MGDMSDSVGAGPRRCVFSLRPVVITATHEFRSATGDERFVRVYEKALTQRFTTDEHSKVHLVALAERGFCHDSATTQLDVEQHHNAILAVPG